MRCQEGTNTNIKGLHSTQTDISLLVIIQEQTMLSFKCVLLYIFSINIYTYILIINQQIK